MSWLTVLLGALCAAMAVGTIYLNSPASAARPLVSTAGLQYFWDFGDGTVSSSANPLHEYQNSGIYKVSLTVKNGTDSTSSVFEVNANQGTLFRPQIVELGSDSFTLCSMDYSKALEYSLKSCSS